MDSQEARIFTAIIIAGILIGIIILYFAVSIIRQQKRNLELQRKQILAEISAMERERTRIANDLHDGIGPLLSVIKFSIDGMECKEAEDTEQLKKATRQIDEVMEQMRGIAVDLMPNALLRKGLATAASEFLSKIEGTTGMHTRFFNQLSSPISREKSINIFRILQEAVHNAVKHAGASELVVSLEEKKESIFLLIKDNGRGFDYKEKKEAGNGFGLSSIKSRVELMKGSMRVESKEKIGSAFLFQIPLGE
jgi:two-component system, NarL family, sensor kinase